ncbi:MAG: hydroxyacylglutathione hydrolase [Paraglaciecola sp.]|uniref:hydroxyacylglutathione hydrolase n=1 Tax=Paraglaciecola sp. TaxID=1920173 RepID=UPI00273EA0E3|nr:hydroxyacylglutathione hydrolase [Paraglaciecola sp.]MDP5029833.1 hydroxyacylglutathione hydrolase [Paraglaciecola sp.]MDP5133284.1 hydroxyacylglutathione hydrolase [Paraglaciecola sp.]
MSLQISAIKAFQDNYIWCLHNSSYCYVVDPGDAQPVIEFCQTHKLSLKGILITHHHWDHTNGLPELVATFGDITIFGPHNPKIDLINVRVGQGDNLNLPELDLDFTVMEVPGHTLDHIAYYGLGRLFCGDTLFSAGCGRLFEGQPAQMHDSLSQLAALPGDTLVYCTHEYTLANIKFALAVEPNNQALLEYHQWAQAQRATERATLPSSITKELAINPFLRCQLDSVKQALLDHRNTPFSTNEDTFAALRRWKDEF